MPDDALKPDATLYADDLALWAQAQAKALAERRTASLDWANLAEEIDSLGRSQKREIRNRLAVLLAHLLKWAFQPDQRKYGWRVTIGEQRDGIAGVIDDSPSLHDHPVAVLAGAYESAVGKAVLDTGLPPSAFPAACPYPLASVLDPAFFPGLPGGPT